MKIIFTQEEKKVARKSIDGFRQSYVIDAREMIYQYDYKPDAIVSTPTDFIIQQEIEKRLRQAISNKKSKQVIYFHYQINPAMVKNVRAFFGQHGAKLVFALYDPSGSLSKIHKHFDEVIA